MKWSSGPADDDTVEVSQGHNSVLTRGLDGRPVSSRTIRGSSTAATRDYETHVRELLPTADGKLADGRAVRVSRLSSRPADRRRTRPIRPSATTMTASAITSLHPAVRRTLRPAIPASVRPYTNRISHTHQLVSGDYEFVIVTIRTRISTARATRDGTWHGVNLPETITLQPDGQRDQRRRGRLLRYAGREPAAVDRRPRARGSWRMLGGRRPAHCCDSDMAITIDGMTYTGVFAALPRETDGRATLTFPRDRRQSSNWRPASRADTPSLFPFSDRNIADFNIRNRLWLSVEESEGERYQAARRIGTAGCSRYGCSRNGLELDFGLRGSTHWCGAWPRPDPTSHHRSN